VPEPDVTIQVMKNGPLLVVGRMIVQDAEGRAFEMRHPTAVALCRCGKSSNKPFCDGSHKRTCFRDCAEAKAKAAAPSAS
jgi:CDGSH-type Zn-finger protein